MNNDNKTRELLKMILIPVGMLFIMVGMTLVFSSFKPELTGGMVPLTIGVVFLLVSNVIQVLGNKKKENCTYYTTARISGFKTESDSDGGTTTYPVYTYSYGGNEYTVRSNVYDYRMQPRLNQEVNIYLNPEDPENSYIENYDKTLILINKIFRYIGIGLVIIGSGVLGFLLII
ncbi:MAG: DUF3592 domain-containing protein [Erysipelotrichaceae bacterium]|nr:DUF3592 domain-containing protein [Erysipelotrichaceae bacterium]